MPEQCINRSATRKFILEQLRSLRPFLGFTNVSKKSLETLEARLRAMIIKEIKEHPSVGKTFMLE